MADDGRQNAMDKYRETSVAFDDLIVQVGRAIARAQEQMDLGRIEFQRAVLRAFKEGRMSRLDITPAGAYAIPETKLELKIGMSMSYPEGGGEPELTAVPLNAATTNRNDINVEAATEIKLRFASVPRSQEPPGPNPSRLSSGDAQQIAGGHWMAEFAEGPLTNAFRDVSYSEQERLWLLSFLEAREPSYLVLADDRNGEAIGAMLKNTPPTLDELQPVGPPAFAGVSPRAARRGDLVTIQGDNFLTLSGQTIITIDGTPVPAVRSSMTSLTFKAPGWVMRGDVEVITPLGATAGAGAGAYTPVPDIAYFEPLKGSFDSLRGKGSLITVYGNNLREGCGIRFSTGALGRGVKIISSGKMQVEAPEDAGTGPLVLFHGSHESSSAESFIMLPGIDGVSPRQGRIGDEVTITGNHLDGVTDVLIGDAAVLSAAFTLHTPGQIRFRVPSQAFDGRIRVRQRHGAGEYDEIFSRDIFYIVPRITGFGARVALPGQLLTVYGQGLDPDPDMMTLLFDAKNGVCEAPVLSVAQDRGSFTTRVPADAVTGYVMLIRKRVFSGLSVADTSNTSQNKITVLTANGDPSDVIVEERFETDLSRWTSEYGVWNIQSGMLLSQGPSRLALTLPGPQTGLALYADVLRAECFGFSLTPEGSTVRLQAWVNLLGTMPEISWSSLDEKGKQAPLGVNAAVPLSITPGRDHLVKLLLQNGVFTLFLDQQEVHRYEWGGTTIAGIALLGLSATQQWDNVVCLKGDYLSLARPEFYRFGAIPEPPSIPLLRVDGFEPSKGPEGAEVTLTGEGLDGAARFFFGPAEGSVIEAAGVRARVRVPEGARSGPIEVRGRGGAITTTGERHFILPPKIAALSPGVVLAGQELSIIGTNLPPAIENATIKILGAVSQIVASSSTMMTAVVPDLAGEGAVTLEYAGFVASSPALLTVNRENVLLDMKDMAEQALWTAGGSAVKFGILGGGEEASVQARESEKMEDGEVYARVLYLHPPAPSLRALRGVYPDIDLPKGRLELRMELGMLWSAAPSAEDITEVDGVVFEISFMDPATGEEESLLPKTACVHDGTIERYVIDAGGLAGKKGRLTLSVFAGRTGLRDDTAVVNAQLVHLS